MPPGGAPEWLAVADAGIFFDARASSAKAVSPTKLGEYLAAGLPIVANVGIGDSQGLLEGSAAGVVVRAFDEEEYQRVARELRARGALAIRPMSPLVPAA